MKKPRHDALAAQQLLEKEILKSKYGAKVELGWERFVFPMGKGTEYVLTLSRIRVIHFGTEINWKPSKNGYLMPQNW